MLPILNKLLSDPQDLITDGEHTEPQAIIVSPTRELTVQIFNEARKFSYGSVLKVAVAYGGTAARHQADKVRVCLILYLVGQDSFAGCSSLILLSVSVWLPCFGCYPWSFNGFCEQRKNYFLIHPVCCIG